MRMKDEPQIKASPMKMNQGSKGLFSFVVLMRQICNKKHSPFPDRP